jgi:polyisoprenoid-binding protein YceI
LRLSLALVASGCATHAPVPAGGEAQPLAPAAHLGAPFDVVGADSLLEIRAYRAGALASAGHNHIIASHDLTGTVYLPAQVLRTSFEVHVPLATLAVDEAQLRAKEMSPDFPPEVPESARQGTRAHMLGPELLDADNHPEIILRALGLTGDPSGPDTVLAHIQANVRGADHAFTAPVRYARSGDSLTMEGEVRVRQSDLGLKPYSALLGGLQVQDEMLISFRIVARAAPTH